MDKDAAETDTRTLHLLNSYEPGREWDEAKDDPRLVQDFEPNVLSLRPPFVKAYDAALLRTPLPRDLPVVATPALEVLAGGSQPTESGPGLSGPLDPSALSRLLHLSAGVVRTSRGGTQLFRAAGSAGGRFPLELYVVVPADQTGAGVPAGVHWYDAVDHALVRVGPAPRAGAGALAPTIVVTGIPWRTGWRYRERGYRHIYWDAGTMLSQLLALADSAALGPRLYTRFPDDGVSALVGADRVHEWPVALVTLGAGAPAIDAAGPAAVGGIDGAPLEFPAVTAAQRAGDSDALAEPWDLSASVAAPSGRRSESLDEVIIRRGSQRRMDASGGVPLDTLRTCMTLALRGIEVDHWIAVHDVPGLASGVYRWPDLATPVRPVAEDELRAELYTVCLEQSLGRDAAFVVIAATEVSRLSDRGYREAQLAAGIVEGRLHLAAYALGAGATGMTFMDSEIPALLGADLDALIFTCVGVPDNTSKPAGAPGAPNAVRIVVPRD